MKFDVVGEDEGKFLPIRLIKGRGTSWHDPGFRQIRAVPPDSQGIGGAEINRPDVSIHSQFSPDEIPTEVDLQRSGDYELYSVVCFV